MSENLTSFNELVASSPVPVLSDYTPGECLKYLLTHERPDSNKRFNDYIKEVFSHDKSEQ